jgi:putative toxin-antitoxin system antitoxin component (TIGR02293 family)
MQKATNKTSKQSSLKKVVSLAEPIVLYETLELSKSKGSKKEINNIILSEISKKPESAMSAFEKMGMAKTGLNKKDLETLKQKASLDYDELAQMLSVTRATLINKKGDEKFSIVLSERIIAIADIYSYGVEVFGDMEQVNEWMFEPNRALGGETPFSIMHTQFGREELRNVIGRIAYGVYS